MNKFIKVGNDLVPVSEEIYTEYYRMKRRERYMENDVKVGRIDVDMDNEKVTFIESKEDSIERLMELGQDFSDLKNTEDIICDKSMLSILHEAMQDLSEDEQKIINAIYFKNQTIREIADNEKVTHVAILKRQKKIVEKLKKYFSKSGYQTPPPIG